MANMMMDYPPMVDMVTVPVVDNGEKIRAMYREMSERARRRNERISLGYARMSYLHCLEQERLKPSKRPEEKMPA